MTQINKVRLSPPGQLHPLSILRMLWKRKVLIVTLAVMATAAGVYLVHRMPNIYRADALILVDSQKIPEKFVASTVQVSLQDSLSAISQQLLSTARLQTIIDDFGLYKAERAKKTPDEIVERMRKDDLSITLERSFSGNRSGAFRIAYEGPDPNVVTGVVSRVADLFVQENLRTREERAAGTSEFIESQLQQAKKSLDEQEATLSQYKLQYAGELPQQEGALMATLSRLQAELEGNQDATNRIEQSKIMLESTLRFAESSLAAATRAAAQPAIAVPVRTGQGQEQRPAEKLTSDVIRAQLEAARLRYEDDHPEVRRLKSDLKLMLAEEARVAAQKRSTPQSTEPASAEVKIPATATPQQLAEINRERERVLTTKTQLELVNKDLENRAADHRRVLASIAEYQKRVERLPIREQQMAGLTRDYENSKVHYRSLLDKKISAEMATEMERQQQSERFTIADPPRVPNKPVKPKRLVLYLAAACLSLAGGIAVALALELMKNKILGEWELPSHVRVLGHISIIDTPSAGRLSVARASVTLLCLAVFGSLAFLLATGYIQKGLH